ncbi:hypothetical protein OG589_14600 [Sphaerisporangium sp. NBC_01403]|uniref:hypothetical protein n=1 Tax=Sphaerisporangium sp. NBC_01403 TaxID=2903599 RepID=UPI00324BC0A8
MATTADITVHVQTDALLSVLLTGRYRLIGDENCGVGIECLDCFDGGRPLGYYDSGLGPYSDPQVVNVDTIPALLAVATDHETTAHGPEGDSVDIPGVPDSIPRGRVIELVQSLGLDPRELVSFEIKGRSIEAVVYALNEQGGRYFEGDGPRAEIAKHRISIPITDASPSEES